MRLLNLASSGSFLPVKLTHLYRIISMLTFEQSANKLHKATQECKAAQAAGLHRPKVDGFVPRIQHVNLGIVRQRGEERKEVDAAETDYLASSIRRAQDELRSRVD